MIMGYLLAIGAWVHSLIPSNHQLSDAQKLLLKGFICTIEEDVLYVCRSLNSKKHD